MRRIVDGSTDSDDDVDDDDLVQFEVPVINAAAKEQIRKDHTHSHQQCYCDVRSDDKHYGKNSRD